MMTDRELMQQALEALAQPEDELVIDCPRCGHCCPQPAAWVGLTDEEITDLWSWAQSREAERCANTGQHAFARAIEKALKEKNT